MRSQIQELAKSIELDAMVILAMLRGEVPSISRADIRKAAIAAAYKSIGRLHRLIDLIEKEESL